MNEAGVDDLADRLGVTARHLRRLFARYVGATPISVAQAHRLLFAKKLLGESSLSITDIALGAGFGSIRRFNAVMQRTYGRTPSQLRRSIGAIVGAADGVTLKLPFRPPFDWAGMVQFLAPRAIPGVETVDLDRYCRSFAFQHATGLIQVQPSSGECALSATIWTSDVSCLAGVVSRLRGLFDLDADMPTINEQLASDPMLAEHVRARPGLRVPGAWDAFELAACAMLTQDAGLPAARKFAGRLAAKFGARLEIGAGAQASGVHRVFPPAAVLCSADLSGIGLTPKQAASVKALAAAVARGPQQLRVTGTLDDTITKLNRLPSMSPSTSHYVAMRGLQEPDAFPEVDARLLQAGMMSDEYQPTREWLLSHAESWRPWRAYAAVRLWAQPLSARFGAWALTA